MKLSLTVGNFMSGVFLIVFYFTVFALFAVPYRLFAKTVTRRSPNSTWIPKKKTPQTLDDFKYEY